MALIKIVDGAGANAFAASENTVVLVSREPGRSGPQQQTIDVWEGSTAAIREQYDEYQTNSLVSNIGVTQNGSMSTLRITWSVSFTEGEIPEDDPNADDTDGKTWTWDFVEIPTPLAAHPYFQTSYIPASGEIIEDEIARCDSFIKRGRQYTASGAYADWVSRYYALRMAGVEEWIQYGVELRKNYTSDVLLDAQTAHEGVGQVFQIAAMGVPADVLETLNVLQKIDSYTTALPTSYVLTPALFEYVKRPPSCGYSSVSSQPRFDIMETWIGVQEWSAVIYPGGSWDPQGETE